MKPDKPVVPTLKEKEIRLPKVDGALHAAIKSKAASLGMTMEQFILDTLSKAVK